MITRQSNSSPQGSRDRPALPPAGTSIFKGGGGGGGCGGLRKALLAVGVRVCTTFGQGFHDLHDRTPCDHTRQAVKKVCRRRMTKQSCRAGEARSWKETLPLPHCGTCAMTSKNKPHQQPAMRSEAARKSAIDKVPGRPLTISKWVWHQSERPPTSDSPREESQTPRKNRVLWLGFSFKP